MNITLHTIKEFWKLPEGKQFLSACFLVIGVLCSIITIDRAHTIPAKDNVILRLTQENGRMSYEMQKDCDAEKASLIQKCTDGKEAFYRTRIAALELKERYLDSAINLTNQITRTLKKSK